MPKAKKSTAETLATMSEEHRRMVAEGIATMHRFAATPSFRDGNPQYKFGDTVAGLSHVKRKSGR